MLPEQENSKAAMVAPTPQGWGWQGLGLHPAMQQVVQSTKSPSEELELQRVALASQKVRIEQQLAEIEEAKAILAEHPEIEQVFKTLRACTGLNYGQFLGK